MIKIKIFKKIISLSLVLLLSSYSPFAARAVLATELTPPSAPTPPQQTVTPPPQPTAPPAPTEENVFADPTPTPVESAATIEAATSTPTPTPIASNSDDDKGISNTGNGSDSDNDSSSDTNNSTETNQDNSATIDNYLSGSSISGSNSGSENVGNTTVQTGDASLLATISIGANQNSISPSSTSGSTSPISISNDSNGTGSNNDASHSSTNTDTSNQTNTGVVVNNAYLESVSGENSASKNVGDTAIISGDSNLGATVITGINTNLDGVAIAQFDVNDNHTGDIILAFPTASACTATVCGVPVGSVSNTGNGSDSENDASLDSTNTSTTNQINSADLTNNLVFEANSGDNTAEDNTGGDSTITSGDANVSANVVSFLNNNIVGNGTPVLVGVVNIFGELIGDIIMPDLDAAFADSSQTNVSNIGNGSGSDNTASLDSTNTSTTNQSNVANINNNIGIDATTGQNVTDDNTYAFGEGGDVETGDVSVDANVINIANNNVAGNTWWVVLINNAGQWLGSIIGAEDGATYAGSTGTDFVLDESGNVIAISNTGNGADSTNNASANSTSNTTTNQSNTANLTNNISVNANTGGNSATDNTGGSNNISTGDANVLLNVVNFVNNNFSGGRYVFTIVNVFGKWVGDVVTPGSHQDNTANATGGPSNDSTGQNNSNNNQEQNVAATTGNDSGATTTVVKKKSVLGAFRDGSANVLGALTGSNTNIEPTVSEDNTIQVPHGANVAASLGTNLDIRLLYGAISLSILIFLIRRPKVLKKLATLFGLL